VVICPSAASLQNAKEPLPLRAGLFFSVLITRASPRVVGSGTGNVSAELSVWHNSITNVCPIGDLLRGGALYHMPLNKPSVGGLEVDRGLVSQRQGTSLRRTARLVQIAGQPRCRTPVRTFGALPRCTTCEVSQGCRASMVAFAQ
jgi:hypothetical protein